MPGTIDLPEQTARAEQLIKILEDYELPHQTRERLMVHLEKTGRFDQAEDALFDLLEDEDSNAWELGKEFYERPLLKSDAELEAGGHPRDEAVDGLNELLEQT